LLFSRLVFCFLLLKQQINFGFHSSRSRIFVESTMRAKWRKKRMRRLKRKRRRKLLFFLLLLFIHLFICCFFLLAC